MSKLPNAPLIEVIFELKWQINRRSDFTKYQYLVGDLYSVVKDRYPIRENLVPSEIPPDVLINKPIHRFRSKQNGYPLIQIGPGLITLNTNDENYYWEDFYELSKEITSAFFDIYPVDHESFNANLLYLDFFEFDFKNQNVNDFLNDLFNITISQNFIKTTKNPYNLDLGFFHETDLGKLSVTLKRGSNSQNQDGVVMNTMLQSEKEMGNKEEILNWLNDAHEFSSDMFKKITEGKLYKSFH